MTLTMLDRRICPPVKENDVSLGTTPVSTQYPDRLITFSPFHHVRLSYGLILYCYSEDCWAMVKRPCSICWINLLRGNTRQATIDSYIDGLLESEAVKLGEIVETVSLNKQILKEEGNRFVPNYNQYDYDQACQIIQSSRSIIIESLSKPNPDRLTEEWTFPKGRPIQGEAQYDCAERECEEELGLELPADYILCPERIHSVDPSPNYGIDYVSEYWALGYEKTFLLPSAEKHNSHGEVAGRSWIKRKDMGKIVRGNLFDTISLALHALNIRKQPSHDCNRLPEVGSSITTNIHEFV